MKKQNKKNTNDSPKIMLTENAVNIGKKPHGNKDKPYITEDLFVPVAKKPFWLIWILMGIIVLLLILLLQQCQGPGCNCDTPHDGPCPEQSETLPPDINIGGGSTDPNVPDEDPNQGDYVKPDTPVAGGVAIPGWAKLTIPVNTSENIIVDFYNPEQNADKYYLTFELRIPADNEQGYEVLYTSGLISPGKHIQRINLTRGLPAGTYNAILHVQPYRMSDKTKTNNADLKLELIVK